MEQTTIQDTGCFEDSKSKINPWAGKMDEDPLIAEDITSCLKCNTTFETHEECFVHTCAQIKTESNELDDEKQTNSFDQENFKSDMNPDF